MILQRLLNRPIGTAESDAILAEVASGVTGLAIMAIGAVRVFEMELEEPARLLGLAVAVLVGLSIVGIGLLGGIKARLALPPRPQA